MKFFDTEHVAVVGDSHAAHAVADGLVYKPFDARLAVQDRVVGMYVKMYEIFHSCYKCKF